VGSVFANSGLENPFGLAFDSAGNLYVTSDDNTIHKFTNVGIGSLFASTGTDTNLSYEPGGLAFDSAGSLYVATYASGAILKFPSQNGVLSNVSSVFASGTASGLSEPTFLAFTDDNGVPLKLANQVPEPSTWALLGFGLFALLQIPRLYENCRSK
jgi:DNA-binding beta-propeller fold protein YncE